MKELTIYLAGAMSNLKKSEYNGWRIKLSNELKRVSNAKLNIINPADYFEFNDCKHLQKEIMQFDLNMVRQSDIVIVNTVGIDNSIGTAIEVYEAHKLNIPVIAFTENGIIHTNMHPWINECISTREMDFYDVIRYVEDFYMIRY